MNFDSEVTLAHINPRREKAGEGDGPVAFDLKVTGDLPIETIAGCFATMTGYAQLAALWRKDGELVTGEWGAMSLLRVGTGVHVEISPPLQETPMKFDTANFNNIRVTPQPGNRVAFVGRVQVVPSEDQMEALIVLLGKTVRVKVELAQKELALVGGTDVAGNVGEQPPEEQQSLLGSAEEQAAERMPEAEAQPAAAQQEEAPPPPPARAGFGTVE